MHELLRDFDESLGAFVNSTCLGTGRHDLTLVLPDKRQASQAVLAEESLLSILGAPEIEPWQKRGKNRTKWQL